MNLFQNYSFLILEKVPSSKGLHDALKTKMYVCPACDFNCIDENEMKIHCTSSHCGAYNLKFHLKELILKLIWI